MRDNLIIYEKKDQFHYVIDTSSFGIEHLGTYLLQYFNEEKEIEKLFQLHTLIEFSSHNTTSSITSNFLDLEMVTEMRYEHLLNYPDFDIKFAPLAFSRKYDPDISEKYSKFSSVYKYSDNEWYVYCEGKFCKLKDSLSLYKHYMNVLFLNEEIHLTLGRANPNYNPMVSSDPTKLTVEQAEQLLKLYRFKFNRHCKKMSETIENYPELNKFFKSLVGSDNRFSQEIEDAVNEYDRYLLNRKLKREANQMKWFNTSKLKI